MSDEMTCHYGGCACGGVSIKAYNKPKWVGHCHCPACRQHTGSAFTTYAGYERCNVFLSGEHLKSYSGQPNVTRYFCGQCGASLAYSSSAWPEEIHLHVAVMEKPEDFKPMAHAYTRARVSWAKTADDLYEYEDFPDYPENADV